MLVRTVRVYEYEQSFCLCSGRATQYLIHLPVTVEKSHELQGVIETEGMRLTCELFVRKTMRLTCELYVRKPTGQV